MRKSYVSHWTKPKTRPSWVGTLFPLYLMMKTDSVSETLCLKKLKTMDSVQSNTHVYFYIPSQKHLDFAYTLTVMKKKQVSVALLCNNR
jgi:hypothetical protein